MRVLVIGDAHCPFDHDDYLPFLKEMYKKHKCDKVVCAGDEMDMCAISTYPSDPDGRSAGDEFTEGLQRLRRYYEAFPNVSVCESNHTSRPYKLAFLSGIPRRFIVSTHKLLDAPKGWKWKERWIIDRVLYFHGDGFSGAYAFKNAAERNRMSTVIGHVHSFAGVEYLNNFEGQIFGMNVGCGINAKAYAFRYAKTLVNKPVLGCGIVIDGKKAYFEPMV